MSAKYMSNIKSIGTFARLYCFVEICWNLHPFPELKNVVFANFGTFLKFSKCKALGDFLISFLEIVPPKGCLGGISQNSNFWNWIEILDIFGHWLLMLQRPRFGILLLTLSCVNVGFFCLSLQTSFPVIFTALQESVLSILTYLVFRLNLT